MGETFLVVGAGLAGMSAAMQLRTDGFDGRILVLGEEQHPPYSRPPLSKGLVRGKDSLESTYLRPQRLYERRAIEFELGVRVDELDVASRRVRLDDGRWLAYDKLLLATGGRARSLPDTEGLPGVHLLRTLDDAVAIRDRLADGASLAVVGAGFIGAELAASARAMGSDVGLLEAAPYPLARVLPPVLGSFYLGLHRKHGVDVRVGTGVEHVESHGHKAHALTTEDRWVSADLLVVAVGLVPNTEVAEAAGIAVNDGILVDEHCRTSAPDVFAAGDVANHPQPFSGSRSRIEHWQTAQHHGAHAARNMLGKPEAFTQVPWVWSDQYDVRLEIAGRPMATDEVLLRGRLEEHDASAFLLRDGRLIAMVGVNRGSDVRAARALIATAHEPDRSLLIDDSVDLAEVAEEARVASAPG